MTKRGVGILLVAAILFVTVITIIRHNKTSETRSEHVSSPAEARQAPAQVVAKVPAHYESAPDPASLAPTLTPAKFIGKTRDAYEVARKIPATLAQLPCYCHCDETVGHKSLHSCFADEHAASCAVCVDEALLAYKLEKSGKTPSQIREQIIAQYAETAH